MSSVLPIKHCSLLQWFDYLDFRRRLLQDVSLNTVFRLRVLFLLCTHIADVVMKDGLCFFFCVGLCRESQGPTWVLTPTALLVCVCVCVCSPPGSVPQWAFIWQWICLARGGHCCSALSKHVVYFKVQTPRPGLTGWISCLLPAHSFWTWQPLLFTHWSVISV